MSVRTRMAAAWILAGLAAAACSAESPDLSAPRLAHDGGCDNAAPLLERLGDGEHRGLRGDVDGNGRADDVFIAIDERAEIGCRGVLFVITEEAAHAIGVDTEATQLELGQPALRLLVEVDGEPGAEAVVDVQTGASTGFVAVFALGGDGLGRVRVRGRPRLPDGLFAYGGSVGHADGVDCSPSGDVIVYSALARGDHYLVRRWVLTAVDGVLAADRMRSERVPLDELFVRWPQLAGPPFASCPEA